MPHAFLKEMLSCIATEHEPFKQKRDGRRDTKKEEMSTRNLNSTSVIKYDGPNDHGACNYMYSINGDTNKSTLELVFSSIKQTLHLKIPVH